MEKVGLFLTMRTSSTRLPNKALEKLSYYTTVLDWNILRMKATNELSGDMFTPILCTSYNSSDDEITSIALSHGIKVYRGPLDNKIGRWVGACKTLGINKFINIDGDDCFFGPELVIQAANMLKQLGALVVVAPKNIAVGGFTYGFNIAYLNIINDLIEKRRIKDTEMVDVFIDKNSLGVIELPVLKHYLKPNYRLTLDYAEDLHFMKTLIDKHGVSFSTNLYDVIQILNSDKGLLKINANRAKDWKDNQTKKVDALKKEFKIE